MHNQTPTTGREDSGALSPASPPRPSTTKITIAPVSIGSRGQKYSVSLDGKTIIASTINPTGDACRHLVALGRAGRLEVWDDDRPYPRLVVTDISKAAGLTVRENERHGPRFAVYKLIPDFSKEAA